MCYYNFNRDKLPLLGPIPLDLSLDYHSISLWPYFLVQQDASSPCNRRADQSINLWSSGTNMYAYTYSVCVHWHLLPADLTHVETVGERAERARVWGIKNSTAGVDDCAIDGDWRRGWQRENVRWDDDAARAAQRCS